jgi:Na+/H+-dicarboxylate symporter
MTHNIKKSIPLYLKILLGMGLGIIVGIIGVKFGLKNLFSDWVEPFGKIFMNLLKLIAIPLIFVSLIKGVSGLKDISQLSKLGLRTLSFYITSTIIAISFGLILVNIIQPGTSFPKSMQENLIAQQEKTIEENQEIVNKKQDEGPLQFLIDIVPDNFFNAASSNRNMLQVIFFALIFGISIILLPEEKTKTVRNFFDELNDVILKMIDLIMKFAPYGVFALMAAIITEIAGDNISNTIPIFKALGLYSITVIVGLLFMIFIIYPIFLKIFTKRKYLNFYKAILPAQLMAFSTSSSSATLPVTMECAEKNLKIDERVSSFVLPVGATINMDGTSLYQAIAAVFIAQVFGFDLTFGQQIIIVLTATLASIGSAGVPGAGIVMLIIVLEAIGVPSTGIAFIFAVDRFLDMLRTVVNITGDSTINAIMYEFYLKKNK